jgi:uncharacterized membrane protein
MNSDKHKFAEGMSIYKLIILFAVFSIFGTYYEMVQNMIRHFLADGSFYWSVRKSTIYGPFSAIYGLGGVFFIVLLGRKERPWYKTILYGALAGGIFEYVLGYLQELITGNISWDYSNKFLNIHGRTTIPYMLIWGLFAFALVKIAYPYLSKWIERIPEKIGKIAVSALGIFLMVDMLISFGAIYRQNERRNCIEATNNLSVLFDKVYPDDVLKKHFPNIRPPKGTGNICCLNNKN